MKNILFLTVLTSALILSSCTHKNDAAPIEAVDFTHVNINDSFWRPRINTNAGVTIPHSLVKCEEEGRFDNFRRAAGLEDGQWRGHWGFDDSDVYKVMEGMAYTYNVTGDPELDSRMDGIIALIGAAQQDDGYLYTAFQLRAKNYTTPWCTYNEDRYDNLKESHEFYNMGHMYEAAVAHYIATGKRTFLDIALKSADHIYETFGPGKREAIPGHQEIEIGLIKLARITGEMKYARLAKLFLDRRGTGLDGGLPYYQNDEKVTDQKYARGHAVRANYMYTAMTEAAILLDDAAFKAAVDTIWNDVVSTKMYITGGLGAVYDGEAYNAPYYLPNASYAETCAAIAGVYWNHKMFLLHGESKYIDILERILYNGLISGISLDGTRFFYPNPMIADGIFGFNRGARGRCEWFDCSCCPTNDCRFLSSVSGYVYATADDVIYQNLYVASDAEISIPAGVVSLTQKGDYPWDGRMTTTVRTDKPLHFALKLRIPCWATGTPAPGGLYSYIDGIPEPVTLLINGKQAEYSVEDGYAVIDRRWQDRDKVEINLPMPVREVVADDRVEADKGLEALERGPIVYCFEEVDNGKVVTTDGDGTLEKANSAQPTIIRTAPFTAAYEPDLLGGVTVLSDGHLKAVPYCVWDNRGDGQMSIWIKRK